MDFSKINEINETLIARTALAVLVKTAIARNDKRLMAKVNALAAKITQASDLLTSVCESVFEELAPMQNGERVVD